MSHVTYEWVMLHMRVTSHMNESYLTYERVISYMKELCHTHEWVVSYLNSSRHTYEWDMSHVKESCQGVMSHTVSFTVIRTGNCFLVSCCPVASANLVVVFDWKPRQHKHQNVPSVSTARAERCTRKRQTDSYKKSRNPPNYFLEKCDLDKCDIFFLGKR